MPDYTGTANDDLYDFNGLIGGETIDGLGGQDTIDGSSNNNNYLFDFENNIISLTNGSFLATFLNFEEAIGGNGNDIMYGGTGAQPYRLDGGVGNDTIGAGSQGIVTGEVYAGGTGTNVLDLSRGDEGYVIDMNTGIMSQGRAEATISGFQEILGSNGNDFIREQTGVQSTLHGGLGDDTLATASSGVGGGEVFDGGAGNDRFDFSNQSTTYIVNLQTELFTTANGGFATSVISIEDVLAGSGNDTIIGTDNSETFRGGGGADRLEGHGGDDLMAGNDGNDFIIGGSGADTLIGGADNDTLAGGDGNDDADGGTGDDLIYGNNGNDTLDAGSGADEVSGGNGDDLILGRAGNDILRGANQDDRILGGADNDTIAGNNGNDTLEGGSGDDRIFGGGGNDTVEGGTGTDFLNGGSGQDVFVFADVSDSFHGGGRDTIDDFTHNVDRIDLSDIMSGLTFIGSGAYSNTAGEVRYNAGIGRLYLDSDGDGASDFSVDIAGAPVIDAGDLIL